MMERVKKFISHNLLTFVLCGAVLVVFNLFLFFLWGEGIARNDSVQNTPWVLADTTAAALHRNGTRYVISASQETDLHKKHVWAMLIDNHTGSVVWSTALPGEIPRTYSLSDVAEMSRSYLKGYPTFTSPHKDGLVVLGYRKNSYFKLPRNNLNNAFLANLPPFLILIFLCDGFLLFFMYILIKRKFVQAVRPLVRGLNALREKQPVHLQETGPLAHLAAAINQVSDRLVKPDKTDSGE